MKFQGNPSLEKEFVECGKTDKELDKQDEANSSLSPFCWQSLKYVQNLKNGLKILLS